MAVVHGVQGSSDGERIWFKSGLITIKVSSADTGGAFDLIEAHVRVGHSTPLHTDPNAETYYVVDGEMLFHIDGREVRATAGDTVAIPSRTPHAFLAVSTTLRYLMLSVPGGQDGFFRAAGEPAPRAALPPPSAPDTDRINSAAAQFGIEMLGPPPFSRAPTE